MSESMKGLILFSGFFVNKMPHICNRIKIRDVHIMVLISIVIIFSSCKVQHPPKLNFKGISLDKSAMLILDKKGVATVYTKALEGDYCYRGEPIKIAGEYYCRYKCDYKLIQIRNNYDYIGFTDDDYKYDYPFKGWGYAKQKYVWRWHIYSIEMQNGYGIVDSTTFYKLKK